MIFRKYRIALGVAPLNLTAVVNSISIEWKEGNSLATRIRIIAWRRTTNIGSPRKASLGFFFQSAIAWPINKRANGKDELELGTVLVRPHVCIPNATKLGYILSCNIAVLPSVKVVVTSELGNKYVEILTVWPGGRTWNDWPAHDRFPRRANRSIESAE